MRIPKRFKLLGQTITVVFDPAHFIGHDNYRGWADFQKNEIQIRRLPPVNTNE
jgi:hypothetical protein